MNTYFTVPISPMKKPRHYDVNLSAKDLTATKWMKKNSDTEAWIQSYTLNYYEM